MKHIENLKQFIIFTIHNNPRQLFFYKINDELKDISKNYLHIQHFYDLYNILCLNYY